MSKKNISIITTIIISCITGITTLITTYINGKPINSNPTNTISHEIKENMPTESPKIIINTINGKLKIEDPLNAMNNIWDFKKTIKDINHSWEHTNDGIIAEKENTLLFLDDKIQKDINNFIIEVEISFAVNAFDDDKEIIAGFIFNADDNKYDSLFIKITKSKSGIVINDKEFIPISNLENSFDIIKNNNRSEYKKLKLEFNENIIKAYLDNNIYLERKIVMSKKKIGIMNIKGHNYFKNFILTQL